jgi:hypothetical protein
MDQIHLNPLVDQIQLALGHISNTTGVLGILCAAIYEHPHYTVGPNDATAALSEDPNY